MGFFEFLTRGERHPKNNGNEDVYVKPTDFTPDGTIKNFAPSSFDDVAKIIDHLLLGQPAIVHLTAVRETTAQRVIDILTGAIYAINGNLSELQAAAADRRDGRPAGRRRDLHGRARAVRPAGRRRSKSERHDARAGEPLHKTLHLPDLCG